MTLGFIYHGEEATNERGGGKGRWDLKRNQEKGGGEL